MKIEVRSPKQILFNPVDYASKKNFERSLLSKKTGWLKTTIEERASRIPYKSPSLLGHQLGAFAEKTFWIRTYSRTTIHKESKEKF